MSPPMVESVETVDPLSVARELRDEAAQYRAVGITAKRDAHGRTAGRYGRRAARLERAAWVIEQLSSDLAKARAQG